MASGAYVYIKCLKIKGMGFIERFSRQNLRLWSL